MTTNVFKFMALRAPDAPAITSEVHALISDGRPFPSTFVAPLLGKGLGRKTEDIVVLGVRAYVAKVGLSLERKEPILVRLVDFLARQGTSFEAGSFTRGLKDALGATPEAFVASKEFTRLQTQAWDALYAFYVLKRVEPLNLEGLLRDLRALDLLGDLAAGRVTASAETLQAQAARGVLIPVELATIPAPPRAKPPSPRPPAATLKQHEALWREFGTLHRAAQEIKSLRFQQTASTTTAKTPVLLKKPAALKKAPTGTGATLSQTTQYQLGIQADQLKQLHEGTRSWLERRGFSGAGINLAALQDQLAQDLAAAQSRILAMKDPWFFERMPRGEPWAIEFLTLANVWLFHGPFFLPGGSAPPPLLPAVKPLGVGDLKVVKQSFERYSAGEIAHIENVLQGEYKERRHRQLNRTEDTLTNEQETNQESERDTQKTDRFELKKETETTIQSDMSVQAGLTVSASYGPVSIGARADFAYSTSSRETNRSSSNFAREIVDRSVEKIQKKARQERVLKILQETEETNLHGLDNKAGAGNISGIYRWVDKHYRAQIYNYGRRLMFEFIVPEPAAYLRFTQAAAATEPGAEPPLIPLGDVTHRDIQDWNYHQYLQRYGVQGAAPPPPAYTTVAVSLAAGDLPLDSSRADTNKELVIPEGYVAKYWTGRTQVSVWSDRATSFDLIVGNGNPDRRLNDEDTQVPVAIFTLNVASYAATIEVHCERTPRHYETWQIQTFEKIVAAHRALKAARESSGPSVPLGIAIKGQNPARNRATEGTELKKQCITLLSNQYYGDFDALRGTPPELDILESLREGAQIQFFEQAFEWEQMTYLFYPYFWGRKPQWQTVLGGAPDPDPLFEQFLKAGAARVLVPVHPIYNEAVLYYLQSGRIWNGGEAPRIGDPLFLALYEEVRDQQDDLEHAIPEGEPWEVVVPTSLVYLQPDFSLATTNSDLHPPSD